MLVNSKLTTITSVKPETLVSLDITTFLFIGEKQPYICINAYDWFLKVAVSRLLPIPTKSLMVESFSFVNGLVKQSVAENNY